MGDDNEEGLEEEDNVDDDQHDLENYKDCIDNELHWSLWGIPSYI